MGYKTKNRDRGSDINYWDFNETVADRKSLLFTHGIEIEYFLLDNDYGFVGNSERFKELVNSFYKIFKKESKTYDLINGRIRKLKLLDQKDLQSRPNGCKDDHKKVSAVSVRYDRGITVDIISKDTHMATGIITVEIVTPPCKSIAELRSWLYLLQKCLREACQKNKLKVLPLASYPENNDFCGEHHHLGVIRDWRLKSYNVIRILIPILMSLSFSSLDFKQTVPRQGDSFSSTRFPNQILRSHRLQYTSQIKPVPPLRNLSLNDFAKACGMTRESCRMVDINPLTPHNTLEIRVFDTQFSIIRTLNMVFLLQAAADYACSLSDDELNVITSIFTDKCYNYFRDFIIRQGFNFYMIPSKLRRSMKGGLHNICTACVKEERCLKRKKIANLSCEFQGKTKSLHELVSLIFFPGLLYNGSESIRKFRLKHLIGLVLDILDKELKRLNYFGSVYHVFLSKMLDLEKTGSLYLIYEYSKNETPKGVYNFVERIQNTIIEDSGVYGDLYDPVFEEL